MKIRFYIYIISIIIFLFALNRNIITEENKGLDYSYKPFKKVVIYSFDFEKSKLMPHTCNLYYTVNINRNTKLDKVTLNQFDLNTEIQNLYPMPAYNSITYNTFNSNKVICYRIFRMTNLVESKVLDRSLNEIMIDIQSLPVGIYILHTELDDNTISVNKFLKK